MPNSDHLVQLSDGYLRDANSEYLSPWGRLDAVFESGYCALLSRVPAEVREGREHPLLELLDGPAAAGLVREHNQRGSGRPPSALVGNDCLVLLTAKRRTCRLCSYFVMVHRVSLQRS